MSFGGLMINESEINLLELVKEAEKTGSPKMIQLANEAAAQLRYLSSIANIDILTGLFNRRGIKTFRNYQAVAMCDVDNFKNVNDIFGHPMGDEVLRSVAQIIRNNIRGEDAACRYGGDEMLIIFSTNDVDIVLKRMENICNEVKRSINLPSVPVTLSVGIAIKQNDERLEDLIQNADDALYESKGNGKDRVTVYKPKQKILNI